MTIDLKGIRARAGDPDGEHVRYPSQDGDDRAALLDLVDAMVGALLAVEWATRDAYECPICHGERETFDEPKGHSSGCCIDDALTRAGFPDEASREAERARRAAR